MKGRRFVVRRSDECGSIVRDGVAVDHTWDVCDRVTGQTAANRDTRKQARDTAREYEAEASLERHTEP